jgi:peptidoglycan/LPS O-acetylase OafA/YrhL
MGAWVDSDVRCVCHSSARARVVDHRRDVSLPVLSSNRAIDDRSTIKANVARFGTLKCRNFHRVLLVSCSSLLCTQHRSGFLKQGALTAALRAGPLACFAYLIWFLARFDGGAAKALSIPAMVAGGEISYSIYLLHPFLLSWFVKPELSFSVAKFGTASGTVVVMSYGTWSLIEVPCWRETH